MKIYKLGKITDSHKKFTQPDESQAVKRLKIILPEGAQRSNTGTNSVSISPDGKTIVYTGKAGNSTMLFKRPLDTYTVEASPGTEGAVNPFFSPDGKWIGFFSEGILRKVLNSGGKINNLCNLSEYGNAIWLPNDSIVIGGIPGEGLKIVSASGGSPSNLTTVDFDKGEWKHNEPSYIYGTSKILYVVESGSQANLSINIFNYKSGEGKVLILNASAPKYIRSGHLLHESEGSVYANSFDVEMEIIHEPSILLIEGKSSASGSTRVQYQISDDGTLVYSADQNLFWQGELVLLDMHGNSEPISSIHKSYFGPKFSPDGKNIAFWIGGDDNPHVWIYNFERESLTRFTTVGQNFWPIWTPDGKSIYFPSLRPGSQNLGVFGKSFNRAESPKKLIKSGKVGQPKAFTKDGKILLYHLFHQSEENENRFGIHLYNMESGESKAFLDGNHNERKPDFSPNDKWVVYESDETGILEIFVTNFPDKSKKIQISTSGGYEPQWSHKGDRIFYRHNDNFYVVHVNMLQEISFSKPDILFSGSYLYSP